MLSEVGEGSEFLIYLPVAKDDTSGNSGSENSGGLKEKSQSKSAGGARSRVQ